MGHKTKEGSNILSANEGEQFLYNAKTSKVVLTVIAAKGDPFGCNAK
jgi:hypothetical protein